MQTKRNHVNKNDTYSIIYSKLIKSNLKYQRCIIGITIHLILKLN